MPEQVATLEIDIMSWFYLFLAGLFEIAWAVGLKQTQGWSRLWPSLVTIALMIISFVFLSLSLRSLPIGTAYAVWTGIGAVGTVLVGIFFFGEPRTAMRIFFIALIVIGIADRFLCFFARFFSSFSGLLSRVIEAFARFFHRTFFFAANDGKSADENRN